MSVANWCFLLLLIAATPAIAVDQEIVRYSGQGYTVTRPFVADGPWESQFEAPDALFIYLLDPDGNTIDIVANQATAGRGSYYSSRAGTYSLQIVGFRTWTVRIVRIR
jgi:hypothetical protein